MKLLFNQFERHQLIKQNTLNEGSLSLHLAKMHFDRLIMKSHIGKLVRFIIKYLSKIIK